MNENHTPSHSLNSSIRHAPNHSLNSSHLRPSSENGPLTKSSPSTFTNLLPQENRRSVAPAKSHLSHSLKGIRAFLSNPDNFSFLVLSITLAVCLALLVGPALTSFSRLGEVPADEDQYPVSPVIIDAPWMHNNE